MAAQNVTDEYQEIAAFAQQIHIARRYNRQEYTVTVSFRDIIDHSPSLYEKLVKKPLVWLSAFQKYVRDTCDKRAQLILTGEPVANRKVTPRALNASALCQLWHVAGVVTRAGAPVPTIRALVTYSAETKTHHTTEFADPRLTLNAPESAAWLPRETDLIREYGLSDFGAVQAVTIQDDASQVPQGRAAVAIHVVLLDTLVDKCKAGDYVEIVGTLLPDRGNGLVWEYRSPHLTSQISQYLLAVSVRQADRKNVEERLVEAETDAINPQNTVQEVNAQENPQAPLLAQRDLQFISSILERNRQIQVKNPVELLHKFLQICQEASPKKRSQSALALELLSASIAPGIYGHRNIKKALVLQQLGGEPRLRAGTRTRGDINILLIGAPGCGKSQLLRSAMKTSYHALSASGRGASGAGLTAAVTVDKQGNRNLAAGAFVLADGGLLAIDEFDKLQIQDRSAVHEAMEQQTVSVSKAGVHVTLNARAAVLAAANCVYGDFQENLTLKENINLPESIISRFDLVFRVRDSHENDGKIASFVLRNHQFAGTGEAGEADELPGEGADPADAQEDKTQMVSSNHHQKQDLFAQLPRELFAAFSAELHGAALRHAEAVSSRTDARIHPERLLLRKEAFRALISICKAKKAPGLTPEAAAAAATAYASLRKDAPQEVLVTVRALESLIRLSTALARLASPPRDVSAADVAEAHSLLRIGLFGQDDTKYGTRIRHSKIKDDSYSETPESDVNEDNIPDDKVEKPKHKKKSKKQQIDDDLDDEQPGNARAELFWRAFDEISGQIGGQNISVDNLRTRLDTWIDERAILEIQHFTNEEILEFVTQRANQDNGVVVDNGIIYF